MNRQKTGLGLITGGIVGVIMCLIAEIFIYANRLRSTTTESFTVVGANEVRTVMVGIENWIPLMIVTLLIMSMCFFVIHIGLQMRNQKN